jgi:hypothetical protein
VVANEAVDYSLNRTSLLSVGQIQHNKLVVDTTRTNDCGNQPIHDPHSGIFLSIMIFMGMNRMANR